MVPRKKKRIIVHPPFYTDAAKKLLDLERLKFFQISEKLSEYLSALMVFIGFLLCLFSYNHILTFEHFSLHQPFFINTIGFLGAMNLLCGLFLLTKE